MNNTPELINKKFVGFLQTRKGRVSKLSVSNEALYCLSWGNIDRTKLEVSISGDVLLIRQRQEVKP